MEKKMKRILVVLVILFSVPILIINVTAQFESAPDMPGSFYNVQAYLLNFDGIMPSTSVEDKVWNSLKTFGYRKSNCTEFAKSPRTYDIMSYSYMGGHGAMMYIIVKSTDFDAFSKVRQNSVAVKVRYLSQPYPRTFFLDWKPSYNALR